MLINHALTYDYFLSLYRFCRLDFNHDICSMSKIQQTSSPAKCNAGRLSDPVPSSSAPLWLEAFSVAARVQQNGRREAQECGPVRPPNACLIVADSSRLADFRKAGDRPKKHKGENKYTIYPLLLNFRNINRQKMLKKRPKNEKMPLAKKSKSP